MTNRNNQSLNPKRLKWWARVCCVIIAFGCLQVSEAQNQASAPAAMDVESDLFWETHDILAAQVLERDTTPGGKPRVTLKVLRTFTPEPLPETLVVAPMRLRFVFDTPLVPRDLPESHAPPVLNKSSILILARPKGVEGDFHICTISQQGGQPENFPAYNALAKISEIRAVGSPIAVLREHVFSENAFVAIYCIRSLLRQKAIPHDEEFIGRLQKMRDNESIDGRLRLAANRLLEESKRIEWLYSAIKDSKQTSTHALWQLMNALVEATSERKQVVEFFLSLTSDPTLRADLRTTSLAVLVTNPRCFDFNQPDEELSQKIFAAAIALMDDKQPNMRARAAELVYRACSFIADEQGRQKAVERTILAIERKLQTETDPDTQQKMKTYLGFLKPPPDPIPVPE